MITRPDRLAVTARFTVSTPRGFARRFNALFPALNKIGEGLDGFAWQLRDRCGNLVAQSASARFVNPRCECPLNRASSGFPHPKRNAAGSVRITQPAEQRYLRRLGAGDAVEFGRNRDWGL